LVIEKPQVDQLKAGHGPDELGVVVVILIVLLHRGEVAGEKVP
jgi:hypothetical protein